MQYVGIDWAYRRAAWCAKQADGTIAGEGFMPADEDGLARLVLELGPEVRACLEMMSGAVWVRDQLAEAGWGVEVGADRRVALLSTIPGIGPVLGLTIAAEIGDVARFASPRKLIGYSGLAPRVKQSGERSRSGELSKAGSRTLRFAAVEAAQGAWRETNPWHRLYSDVKARTGKANPAKSAVARKVLIACWHVLSREQPFKPSRPRADLVPASSSSFLAA